MMKQAANSVQEPSMVYVVDDDLAIRESMDSLIRSFGLRVQVFSTPLEFLHTQRVNASSCLVLDVRLQQASGLDFQTELTKLNIELPIIFITGHGDIAMTVRAMKAGAVDFLAKPFRDQDLLDAILIALEQDRKRRQKNILNHDLQQCYDSLTKREKEVMALAVSGLMNKQIAAHLAVSLITAKIHRGNAMKKMQAKTFADLVKMAESLGTSSKP